MKTDPYGYNRGRTNAQKQAIEKSRRNGGHPPKPRTDPDSIDWDYWLTRMKAILNGRQTMTLNLRIGRIGRLLAPNYSYCRRCETPWRFVKWHDTPYGSAGFGCFPLCEQCWAELTPIERLPFYRELIELWHPPSTRDESTFDDEWPLIYNAVLEGK